MGISPPHRIVHLISWPRSHQAAFLLIPQDFSVFLACSASTRLISQFFYLKQWSGVFLYPGCAIVNKSLHLSLCSLVLFMYWCFIALQNAYRLLPVMPLAVLQCYKMLTYCCHLHYFGVFMTRFKACKY